MSKNFEVVYKGLFNEVEVYWNGKIVFTVSEDTIERYSINYEINWGEAISLIIGQELKNAIENEENGFFVSAVLTKLFGYDKDEKERR